MLGATATLFSRLLSLLIAFPCIDLSWLYGESSSAKTFASLIRLMHRALWSGGLTYHLTASIERTAADVGSMMYCFLRMTEKAIGISLSLFGGIDLYVKGG